MMEDVKNIQKIIQTKDLQVSLTVSSGKFGKKEIELSGTVNDVEKYNTDNLINKLNEMYDRINIEGENNGTNTEKVSGNSDPKRGKQSKYQGGD